MKLFFVRIELHNATASDYDKLHELMRIDYNRSVLGHDGTRYKLPTAEYVAEMDDSVHPSIVLGHVQGLVRQVGKKAWILVSRADIAAFDLDPDK